MSGGAAGGDGAGGAAAIRDAIVVAGPGDAERRIAGVPLVLRTILALQRAGIERCTLVGAPLPHDPRVRCALTHAPAVAAAAGDAPHLLIAPGTVVDEALVRDLQRRTHPGAVFQLGRHGARVRVAPGARVADNDVRPQVPTAGTLEPASRPDAVLECALLRGLENPRDGYLDRRLSRRLSRPLTRLLLRTPLTPNAVTLLGVLAGVAGGLALGSASPVVALAGVGGLVVSGVLDCADGELARLRFHESTLGDRLDIAGDTLVHVALLAGITLRLAATGAMPSWATLTALGLGVAGAFAVITACEVQESRRRRLVCWENRLIDGVLSPLTTRDWYAFPLLFALAGQLDWLVPAAAVGAHGFWIATLVLLVRVLRRA